MTTTEQTVALLFQTRASQWGLRGDPYLWDEMGAYTEADHAPIPVKRFDHGGLSSGLISPDFWRDKAIPELTRRFHDAIS